MILKLVGIFGASLLSLNLANAGWVSGGGELTNDANNPWFLSNTKTVEYCIEVDQANFSLQARLIRKRVKQSLAYWKSEFADAKSDSKIKVASQTFVETPCSKSTDLRFQFGILDQDQFEYIKSPKKYVGVTVRTEYDPVQLRGKGFIYISPDYGPLRLGFLKASKNVWSSGNGTLLRWVLTHELGHVFGLSHDKGSNLMNKEFPGALVEEVASTSAEIYESFHLDYFKYRPRDQTTDIGTCYYGAIGPKNSLQKFFGITKECFEVKVDKDLKLNIFQKDESDANWHLVGTAKLKKTSFSVDTMLNSVSIWLTSAQQVFPYTPAPPFNTTFLYRREPQASFKGTFQSVDGQIIRQMTFSSTPDNLDRVGGILDGKLYVDLTADN